MFSIPLYPTNTLQKMELSYKSGTPAPLWKPNTYPVYLFYGEEDRLKTEALNALKKQIVAPDYADFDYEVLDAGEKDAATILSAVTQIPFGSDKRMVVVKGAEFWRERGKSSEAEKIAEGIAKLGGTACLLLIAAAGEEEGKRKTALTTKLDNAVKKYGVAVFLQSN